jgi:hypothetical protein
VREAGSDGTNSGRTAAETAQPEGDKDLRKHNEAGVGEKRRQPRLSINADDRGRELVDL